MLDTYRSYRTFIASPGDVSVERASAEEVISRLNKTVRDTLGVIVDPVKWEDRPPVTTKLPAERLQDVLNKEVENCKFFVLILYKRYGNVESGHLASNTEREIDTVLAAHRKEPKRKILAYFRRLDPNGDAGVQEEKVRALRQRLADLGLAYREYSSPEEFRNLFTHDLYDVVLKIQLSPFKKQTLAKFWQFGDVGRSLDPRVALIYPPVNRDFHLDGGRNDFWLKRLSTQMAFEDYKAIEKIQKTFQLLGLSSYRVYSHLSTPPELPRMNRIWLCLPRNRAGLNCLQVEHKDRRFDLPVAAKRPSHISWRGDDGTFTIKSPMADYLKLQRKRMNTSGEWTGALGKMILKDFAVLARLKRPTDETIDDEPLWDYFFAGIRGLGTWGASWFVDREYKQLGQFDAQTNIELLLEVTFRNGRVLSAVDVSSQPKAYFERECEHSTIRTRIKEFTDSGH